MEYIYHTYHYLFLTFVLIGGVPLTMSGGAIGQALKDRQQGKRISYSWIFGTLTFGTCFYVLAAVFLQMAINHPIDFNMQMPKFAVIELFSLQFVAMIITRLFFIEVNSVESLVQKLHFRR